MLNRKSAIAAKRSNPATSMITRQESLTGICQDLPPIVYFIKTRDGLIKIGHTVNLANRKVKFGSGWQHILAVVPGSRDDEAAMHAKFGAALARGREYFHPVSELVEYVNDLRGQLGVAPVTFG